MQNYVDTGLVRGAGTAVRDPRIPEHSVPCDTIVCHTYDGQQLVTIRPLAADLDFQGTHAGVRSHSLFVPRFVDAFGWRVSGYTQVVFTDSTLARGMPRHNLSHLWVYADPLDPGDSYWHKTENTCYAGNVYCAVNIKESGTMISTTRVNGVVHSDSVLIYCSETESILNGETVRQMMMALLDSSNAADPVPENRHERYYLILQDTVTPGAKPYLYIMPRQPGADVCQAGELNMPDVPLPWPNTKILAYGHDHTSAGEVTKCKNEDGTFKIDPLTGDTLVFPHVNGASISDWDQFRIVNDPVENATYQNKGWLPMPSFVIDKVRMYTMRITDSEGDETKPGNLITWGYGRCKWPRR
ncbi:MAG: hypothetical protein M3O61_09540 [Gemmatimonadota bacterium]|nr:hypothetical protein [Gemmatimonadota bacterium]